MVCGRVSPQLARCRGLDERMTVNVRSNGHGIYSYTPNANCEEARPHPAVVLLAAAVAVKQA